jgi:hypothetical protein
MGGREGVAAVVPSGAGVVIYRRERAFGSAEGANYLKEHITL